MKYLITIFCALALIATAPALAAGGGGGGGGGKPSEGAVTLSDLPLYNSIEEATQALMEEFGEDETCPRNVDVPSIVIPIASGRYLYGYAFVTPRLCLARGVNDSRVIERLHFLVDEMVRTAHRHPFQIDGQGNIDREATRELLLTVLNEATEAGQIERLDLLGSDIRPLQ